MASPTESTVVPLVPEANAWGVRWSDRWRKGPGRRAIPLFAVALAAIPFTHYIGAEYAFNVFCSSDPRSMCAASVEWGAVGLVYASLLFAALCVLTPLAERRQKSDLEHRRTQLMERFPAPRPQTHAFRSRILDPRSPEARTRFAANLLRAASLPFLLLVVVAVSWPPDAARGNLGMFRFWGFVVFAWLAYRLFVAGGRLRHASKRLAKENDAELARLEEGQGVPGPAPTEEPGFTFRSWRAGAPAPPSAQK